MKHLPRSIALASLCAFILSECAAWALDPGLRPTQYVHDVWQTEDGLPQNSVQAIAQTPDGYIWLGTQEGLVRFDGARFTVFDKRSTDVFRMNDVYSLQAGRDGSLWIGTGGGGVVRLKGGVFEAVPGDPDYANSVVTALCEDRHGGLWIGTEVHGVWHLPRSRSLGGLARVKGLPSQRIAVLRADKDGAVWAGTSEGLTRIRGDRIDVFKEGMPAKSVTALCIDSHGDLYVGFGRGQIVRRSGDALTPFAQIPDETIWTLLEDRDGAIWAATDGKGIYRFRDGEVASFRKQDGLSYDLAEALFEDREGNLWIGTSGGGLNRLAEPKFIVYGEQEGLPGGSVSCVAEDFAGTMYIGSEIDGLTALRDGIVRRIGPIGGSEGRVVGALYPDRDGSIWVGTEGAGLARIRKDGSIAKYGAAQGMTGTTIWALYQDDSDDLLVGTYGGGLFRHHAGRFQNLSIRDGLASDMVTAICGGARGRIWIGTNGGGLNCYADGRFTTYAQPDGLSNSFIMSLYEDRRGVLWIGTFGGGLNRMVDGKIAACTSRQGLFDDVVFTILDDELGNFWMSSNKGIFRVSCEDLDRYFSGRAPTVSCTAYDREDGLRGAECNGGTQPAGWRSRDGRLWFATLHGLAVIDPRHIRLNREPPQVLIDKVVRDGRESPPHQAGLLPAGTNYLEIHYTAPTFRAVNRVRFRYKLEGFDADWVEAGARRVAYYTSLRPGRYLFHVLACNGDGVWNETGATLAFVVDRFYYQTAWFFALCVATALLAGLGAHRLRVAQMRRRERELEEIVRVRTHALEEANRRLEELSYQDPLTGVANRRHFEEALASEWKRAHRARTPLSLLMIDVDHFKAYNDALGHRAGDECLRRVAAEIASTFRRTGDLVARYGGEEFAVILPMTETAGARRVADALRQRIESLALAHPTAASPGVVTISIGIATGIPPSLSPDELVDSADRALYQAKEQGRNAVVTGDSMSPSAEGQE